MRNKILAVCLSISGGLFTANQSIAQNVHVVKLGETLSVIAHNAHVSVGELMRYNGLNAKSKLQIGEKLKIPSKKEGKIKENAKETVKEVQPVVEKQPVVKEVVSAAKSHTVEQGESLYRISKKFNIPVAKLREWNNLPDYTIKIGQEIFLIKPSDEDLKATQKAVPDIDPMPVVEKKTERIIEEPKTVVPTKKVTPTSTIVSTTTTKTVVDEQTNEPVITKKVETVTTTTEPVKKAANTTTTNEKGFFASQFVSTKQEVTGTAGVLKTSSGWLDKKYYVLMNNVTPGTIVKVTANNTYIYAKVLEALPEVREDEGLVVRISNAAASVLNVTDNKFPVTINY